MSQPRTRLDTEVGLSAHGPGLAIRLAAIVCCAGGLCACAKLNTAFGDSGTDSGGSQATGGPSPTAGTTPSASSADSDSRGSTTPGQTTAPETETSIPGETSEETSGPSTGAGASVCGDGTRQNDESCDDGNLDNTDRCTTLCQPPTCEDGLRSGLETGIDCGGPCEACEIPGGCTDEVECPAGQVCDDATGMCRAPASCLDHLELLDMARSGGYEIDPLGDGGTIPVFCEMLMNGGGWTQVFEQSFEGGGAGWSPAATASCGPYDVLGLFGAGDEVVRDVELLGVPHTEVWLAASFVMVDNWEAGEEALFWVDDTETAAAPFPAGFLVDGECSGPGDDLLAQVFGFASHEDNFAQLTVTTTLDQGIADESFGLQSITILVR